VLDIRIIVQTAEIDTVTVCHSLFDLILDMFLKISSGEVESFDKYLKNPNYSKHHLSSKEIFKGYIKSCEKSKEKFKVDDNDLQWKRNRINRMCELEDLKIQFNPKTVLFIEFLRQSVSFTDDDVNKYDLSTCIKDTDTNSISENVETGN
jgi:hypothetical protein